MDRAEMVEALRLLVEAESFSTDPEGLERCAGMIDDLCRSVLGTGTTPAGTHQVWRRNGDRPVLLLCHFDTVWPPGTLAEFPFELEDGVARGPGTFDMKAGIVQCVEALRQVPDGPHAAPAERGGGRGGGGGAGPGPRRGRGGEGRPQGHGAVPGRGPRAGRAR